MTTYHFDVDHAVAYGVNEAIMISNLAYWINHNRANKKHLHDGRTWTYNSRGAFAELFPFWSERQVRGITESLIKQGVILTNNYNNIPMDRTLWYAFVDEAKFLISPILHFGQMDLTKKANAFAEKVTAIPDNKPDNKPNTFNTPLPPLSGGTPSATCNEVQGASSTASQGQNPETAGNAESPKSHADTDTATHAKTKGRKRSQEPANRFTPPTEAEVLAYCQERQNGIIASVFVDFYTSKNWMIGKNKMVDWKAAVRTWERNRKEQLQAKADPRQQSTGTFEQANQSDGWIDLLRQQGDQYADIHF